MRFHANLLCATFMGCAPTDTKPDAAADTGPTSAPIADADADSEADADADADDTGATPEPSLPNCIEGRYTALRIAGWPVCMETALFSEGGIGPTVTARLDEDFRTVIGALDASIVERLQTVQFWVEDDGAWPAGVYHPSAVWLETNGYPTHWAESVQIGNAANYLAWTAVQPAMVLHELAHAWHHQFLGYDHPGILEAYAAAMADGRYSNVAYAGGGTAEAYATTNEMEYFAELTEAWFWENDFYPFVRVDLLTFDPLGASVVEQAWRNP